jgi:hypothetical protein
MERPAQHGTTGLQTQNINKPRRIKFGWFSPDGYEALIRPCA